MKNAASRETRFDSINTNTAEINGEQGHRFSWRKAIAFLHTYAGLKKVGKADVVYLTPGQTFFGLLKYAPFMLACLLLRTPYVIHVHGNHLGTHYAQLGGMKRCIFHYFLSRAAAGIVLSASLRANFHDLLPASRIFVVENFAGQDLYALPQPAKPQDMLRILYLSNLMREKGILELLDALSTLQAQGITFHATLAGQLEAGIGPEVQSRLHKLGNAVHYAGLLSGQAKADALRQANVFVLPTYYAMEGQPISLLEGLATGNIIVTTRHAGIPDIIDESNGCLVPVRDSSAIAEVFADIAADIPAHLARYSAHNMAYAASRFTEKSFTDGILAVLQRVTSEGGTADNTQEEKA